MRTFRSLLQGALLLATVSVVSAQKGDGGGSQVTFGEKLSMLLLPGWSAISQAKGDAALYGIRNTRDAQTVSLLLHARPLDAERHSSMTVLRDETVEATDNFAIRKELLERLNERAVSEGFVVEKFQCREMSKPSANFIDGEVSAVAADGRRRIFAGVLLRQVPSIALRCYWQWDENDPLGREEYEAWLSSLTFDKNKVKELLADGNTESLSTNEEVLASAQMTAGEQPVAQAKKAEPVSVETGELVSKNRDALVVVEGQKGRGSGFLCMLNGEASLVTNIHVLSNNPQPRFTTMKGVTVTPGTAVLGVGSDIFRSTVPAVPDMLEVMTDLDSNVRIGDKVVVLGNPEGAGVIKPIEGTIVGIGPNLVEVDAPFVQGNSGSPIVHVNSGKVIGIATYLVIRKVDTDKGGVEKSVRRFGYRLDNVAQWEPLNWPRFYAQSAQAEKIEDTSGEFVELFADARANKLSSSNFTNPGIQRALSTFERTAQGSRRMSASDLSNAVRSMLAELRIAAMSDVKAFDSVNSYDYFKRLVADEKKFRDDICTGFTREIEKRR